MSNKLKLMTILGTRPEIIRLSAVIKCCDKYFDHILVHTGQNYDYTLNQVFFEDLNLREPDFFLESVGKDLGETMGNIIAKSYELMQKERPDAVLMLGDTNSALSAISAKRLKIPIFHMEAGNRCWDWNVSEMINRKIVDHISDINLPYTEHSRRYLLSEGIDGKTIFVTGSPMREVLRDHMDAIRASDVLSRLSLEKGKYILLSAHREENIDLEENFMDLMNSVNHIAEKYQMPVIYSTHPRSRKFIEQRGFTFHPLVTNMKPFGFLDYNQLQMNAYCVLSDSGTLSEESAMLHFPAVLIRTSTERPEVLDKGTIVIGGIRGKDVEQAMELAVSMFENGEETVMAEDYADTNVSVKVVKLIQSYTEIVNKTVWLV
ncbi:UDP-N-acetylglucosamine 2-epimerase (non-hydrolyzing) [bacterium C-53]|nr:UDP-N-acetylglucosamine 2-epimerase (non-hydrolyzing) [Lachnospiraceae bacterium]NBI01593.1 UDP-N-acetylglucosamine 2-epimerase (non-hydrolyzing) [Lachnospiraceae bacterium]RKJ12893.1 UDP-N-acetylglucosamine 2-epimerase (non-hydrolyzing) [bacterium C-53]